MRVTTAGGGALAALGESTKSGESLAAVHKPEITAVESPAKVEAAAPPILAKPKTAKSATPSRPNVAAAKDFSKSKHVESGGSRGRAVAAKSSTKSSVKTASRNSVKRAAKGSVRTASKSSKRSLKTAGKSRSVHGRAAAALKRHVRTAAASAAKAPGFTKHRHRWPTGPSP
ncbi:MAG: hypothetical protein WBW37_04330, partial [Methyloceanibacter sp.]